MRIVAIAVLVAVALSGTACSRKEAAPTRELTERERDSLISRSALPGARAVGRSMATADAESRRAASMQAQVDSLPH